MISNPMLEAESRTTLSDLKPIVVALTPSMLKRNGLRTKLTWVRTPMSTVTSVSSFKIKYPQLIEARSSKRSTLSNTSRRAKNNAIIEKANKLKHDRSAVQQLAAEHGAANCQKVPLAQFN